MRSRYLRSLESSRSSANSPAEEDYIDLKMAGYIARKGENKEAEGIVSKVRMNDALRRDSRVIASANFVEGLLAHLAGSDGEAEKKWRRGAAIARVDNSIEVLATISAWMSFLHYSNGRFDLMFEELGACLEFFQEDPIRGALTSRAEMVIALVLHTCMRTEDAMHWYERSRRSSLLTGDDVEIAALVHNMAWIRLYNYRNSILRGRPALPSETEILRVSSEAVQSYEELVGLASFPALTPLLQAQNYIVQNHFAIALDILDQHAREVRNQGLSRLAPSFNADRAFCLASMGRFAEASTIIDSVIGSIAPNIHSDDLAVLFCRLRDCFMLEGKIELAEEYSAKASKSWGEFDMLVERLLAGIATLTLRGLPNGDSDHRP